MLRRESSNTALRIFSAVQATKTVGWGTTIVPPCAQLSATRAIGKPPAKTVGEPIATLSGGPTQTAIEPGPIAGITPTKTVGAEGAATGPPTCGTTPVTIGQTCMAVRVAAGMAMSGASFCG